jgi:transcriptional regulator
MYLPAHFDRSGDARALDALLERDPFVTLVSTHEGAPLASHLPVLARRGAAGLSLLGHWARPNPQWQAIAGQTVLAIVHGPHAYVSPRWYPDARRAVPTWNYAAAHLYGTVRLVTDEAELLALVDALARRFETGAAPWRLEDTEPTTRRMVAGIVGFEMTLTRIEVKHKLSQNHAAERVAGAIAGLREEGGAAGAEVADLMAAALAERAAR